MTIIKQIYGVPDSLLVGIDKDIEEYLKLSITWVANEGVAVARAAGQFLSSGTPGIVIMQNSGIGNAYNPYVSLCSELIYKIPIVFVIGWRGEMTATGQLKDEPQHRLQGKITIETLKLIGIKVEIIDSWMDNGLNSFNTAIENSKSNRESIALLVRKNTNISIKKNANVEVYVEAKFTRQEFIDVYVKLKENLRLFTVTTTGYTSREYFQSIQKSSENFEDFMAIGGMGHAISIARGYAEGSTNRKVVCLDGDGAEIMHLGAFADVYSDNIIVICFRNYCHESVGAQKVAGSDINFKHIMHEFGFKRVYSLDTVEDFKEILLYCAQTGSDGSSYIECKVRNRDNNELMRPNIDFEKHTMRIVNGK